MGVTAPRIMFRGPAGRASGDHHSVIIEMRSRSIITSVITPLLSIFFPQASRVLYRDAACGHAAVPGVIPERRVCL